MKFAIAAQHDDNYNEFAKLTLYSNHAEYCKRHGYDLLITKVYPSDHSGGFQMMKFLIDNLPNYDWIWHVGVDTLVMNHTIKIEDKIDNNYDYIISVDDNGPNVHSTLTKNSKNGLDWLNFIWSKRFEYKDDCWQENRVVHHYHNKEPWNSFIKVQPYRFMNSVAMKERWNVMNHPAQFEIGDWLLHMSATSTEKRIELINHFKDKVVR